MLQKVKRNKLLKISTTTISNLIEWKPRNDQSKRYKNIPHKNNTIRNLVVN